MTSESDIIAGITGSTFIYKTVDFANFSSLTKTPYSLQFFYISISAIFSLWIFLFSVLPISCYWYVSRHSLWTAFLIYAHLMFHSYLILIYSCGYNFCVYANVSVISISSPDLSLELQIWIFNILYIISTWVSNNRLKLNTSKMELLIFHLLPYTYTWQTWFSALPGAQIQIAGNHFHFFLKSHSFFYTLRLIVNPVIYAIKIHPESNHLSPVQCYYLVQAIIILSQDYCNGLTFALAPFLSTVNHAGRVNPLKWKSNQDMPLSTKLHRLPMVFTVTLQASRWLTRLHRLWSVITLTHMLFGSSCSSPALFPLTPRSLLQKFDTLSAWNVFLPDIYKTESPSLHSGFYSNVPFQLEPSLTPYKKMQQPIHSTCFPRPSILSFTLITI